MSSYCRKWKEINGSGFLVHWKKNGRERR